MKKITKSQSPTPSSRPPNLDPQNPVKILIVEDSVTQAMQLQHILEGNGYSAVIAVDGREALRSIGASRPSIVISDIVMPEMDGFELVQHIIQRQKEKRSSIIILSNLGQKEDVEKGLALGADGYIVKASATPSEVVEKVVEITSHKN